MDLCVVALDLLDYCYRQDDDQTQQLLTCELHNWSGQTCLSLAVAANHRPLLAHPCSQIILADLWMGGLRTRKNTNLKVATPIILCCNLYHVYTIIISSLYRFQPLYLKCFLWNLSSSSYFEDEVKQTIIMKNVF